MLALPLGASLLYFTSTAAEHPAASSEEQYLPLTADALTLLAARGKAGQAPDLVLLIRLDPAAGSIVLTAVPPETMVEDAGAFDAVGGVWRREGGRRAAAALGTALGISIDRWLWLNPEGFVNALDLLGAVDYHLDEPLLLSDGSVMLAEGRQLLDGRRLETLMTHRGYSGGEPARLYLCAALMTDALNQRLGLLGEQAAESLFETAVNAGDNDLTVSDFESRRRAFAYLRGCEMPASMLELEGEYNAAKNTFLPSAQSLLDLQQAFGS